MSTIDNQEPQPMDALHQVHLTMEETKEIIHQLENNIKDIASKKNSELQSIRGEKIHMLEHIIQKLQSQ